MSELSVADIPNAWRLFHIDLLFARNYEMAHKLHSGLAPKNPVLERLVPSLLHVKLVSIFDHSIRAWIDENCIEVPKKPYGKDLNGRIDFLADKGHIADRRPLHTIRTRRNGLAHHIKSAISWAELDRDVETVQSALSALKLVSDSPKWSIFAEQSAAQAGEVPNSICTIHRRIGIRQEDKMIAEIKWSEHQMEDDAE